MEVAEVAKSKDALASARSVRLVIKGPSGRLRRPRPRPATCGRDSVAANTRADVKVRVVPSWNAGHPSEITVSAHEIQMSCTQSTFALGIPCFGCENTRHATWSGQITKCTILIGTRGKKTQPDVALY